MTLTATRTGSRSRRKGRVDSQETRRAKNLARKWLHRFNNEMGLLREDRRPINMAIAGNMKADVDIARQLLNKHGPDGAARRYLEKLLTDFETRQRAKRGGR